VDESWPQIPRLIAEAEQAGIRVAISNPCFELWLLLHQDDQRAFIEGKEAQKLANQRNITVGKNLVDSFQNSIPQFYTEAKKRAIALEQQHRANGNSDFHNPSSNVWKLIDSILDLAG